MRPSEALAMHRDAVLEVIARYPVSNPRLFGSVARGDDTETSDIDILVEPIFGVTTFVHLAELQNDLAALLGKGIDVVTPGGMRKPVAQRIGAELAPL